MSEKTEKRYTLEVSESQLRLIAMCVEDCHRFAAGQPELWNTTSLLDEYSELQDILGATKRHITPTLSRGASYGWNGGNCPNDAQRRFIARTYPIYREIYHFLALQANRENTYSSPTPTCEEGGEPIKIKVLQDASVKKTVD